jgi:hypothetical protein
MSPAIASPFAVVGTNLLPTIATNGIDPATAMATATLFRYGRRPQKVRAFLQRSVQVILLDR